MRDFLTHFEFVMYKALLSLMPDVSNLNDDSVITTNTEALAELERAMLYDGRCMIPNKSLEIIAKAAIETAYNRIKEAVDASNESSTVTNPLSSHESIANYETAEHMLQDLKDDVVDLVGTSQSYESHRTTEAQQAQEELSVSE